jgi:uncharacterized caspase-like protein
MKKAAWALALWLAATLAAAQSPPPAKAQRLALVIGNGAYRDAPLPNPLNDAADMARALEASGFTVIKRENATLREMHLALREFGDRLDRRGTGVFYFAGHGMQVRGRNYLIPVDADIAREDEVAFASLDLGAVMEKLDSAKNPVNLVILDACRNNPFGTRLQASAKGLAQVDAPPGTLIAFATAPGSTAADGTGRNGLYTQHLVKAMARDGAPVEEVFKIVRAGVRSDSKSLQVPWESTSLESAFFFRAPRPEAEPARAPTMAAAAASAARSAKVPVSAPPIFVVGDRWKYAVANQLDGSRREWQMRVTDVRGDDVHYSNGNVSDLLGNNTRIKRADGTIESFTPSTHFYLFPMKPGNKWDLDSVQVITDAAGRKRTLDVQVRLTVVGEEEVEVKAGRMRAMRVERVARWKQRDSENAGVRTGTFWYNGAVKRWVRLEEKNVTSKGKTTVHEQVELASFEVQ